MQQKIVLATAIIFSFLLICATISSSLKNKNKNIKIKSKDLYSTAHLVEPIDNGLSSKLEDKTAKSKDNKINSKIKLKNVFIKKL